MDLSGNEFLKFQDNDKENGAVDVVNAFKWMWQKKRCKAFLPYAVALAVFFSLCKGMTDCAC
jgi:glycosylphosphatidylinositol transamidase (GPIT) subunit GPI8